MFDASAQSWLQKTAEISPAARSNPAMALTSGGVVLVGGLTESGPVADVWVGQMGDSGFTWQEIPGASGVVTPRSSHDMVMLDGAHFLFGGLSTTGVLGDLWRLDDIA